MFDKPIFILINNKISWATNHDEGMSRLKAKKEELGMSRLKAKKEELGK